MISYGTGPILLLMAIIHCPMEQNQTNLTWMPTHNIFGNTISKTLGAQKKSRCIPDMKKSKN